MINLFKQFLAMRHLGGTPLLTALLRRTQFDYAKEVGTAIDASVVTAPVQWVQRAFLEAPLRVVVEREGEREEIDAHPLTQLIAAPNPFYSDDHLWAATLFSYLTAGNAYWLVVRNTVNKPVELWYAPHWLIVPRWPQDGSVFISHYEYHPGGQSLQTGLQHGGLLGVTRLEVEDVVHFRHGIDPRNLRLGLSPLHGAIREIFMDLESSNFQASMLRNMGVPGVVISPDGDQVAGQQDAEAVKKWFQEAFGGDRRGTPLVMASKTKVSQYGFNPKEMDLSVTRNVAEERVCASLGIPAAVVGLGVGLQQTKVGATMNELRRLAWINGVIPLHRAFADEVRRSLLPAFERQPERHDVEFDSFNVAALQEDLDARAKRLDTGVRGGWLQVAEAREAMGFDVTDRDRIFLRGLTVIEVPAGSFHRQDDEDKRRKGNGRDGAIKTHAIIEEELSQRRGQRPSAAQARYVATLARQTAALTESFEERLTAFFNQLGRSVARAALPILEEALKVSPEDRIIAERILEQAGIAPQAVLFREIYQAHYLTVAEVAGEAAEIIGLAADLPDPVARAVVSTGGTRAGLIDLEAGVKRTLFDTLTEGRAAGEGPPALARRIRDDIPRGRWSDVRIRSRVIARTETAFAQNISTIERSRAADLQRALVFDNRTGFDDEICPGLDGIEVTLEEAEALAVAEHPNGTRSFSPIVQSEQ